MAQETKIEWRDVTQYVAGEKNPQPRNYRLYVMDGLTLTLQRLSDCWLFAAHPFSSGRRIATTDLGVAQREAVRWTLEALARAHTRINLESFTDVEPIMPGQRWQDMDVRRKTPRVLEIKAVDLNARTASCYATGAKNLKSWVSFDTLRKKFKLLENE